jgi:hypothetical protein
MRRRGINQSKIEVELFPFLSILACTIGTLILLIIVLATQVFSNEREVSIIAKTETGKNLAKIPRYIECRGDGVIIYPQKKFVSKYNLYNSNSAFLQLLNQVKVNSKTEYLIIAIRPDGFETFQSIRETIEQQGIDMGYEPIDQDVKLKLEPVK